MLRKSAFKRSSSQPHWKRQRKKKVKPEKSLVPKNLGLSAESKEPWRSDIHKRRVVACGCLVPRYSSAPSDCWGPIDPHHVTKWRGGGGAQPSDALVVPLCRKHHDEAQGRDAAFEQRHGIVFAKWIKKFSPMGCLEITAIEEKSQ